MSSAINLHNGKPTWDRSPWPQRCFQTHGFIFPGGFSVVVVGAYWLAGWLIDWMSDWLAQ
jgi:hypothetical protein